MALFFDAAWFDARLGERGLDRGALAGAAGLSRDDLALVINNERAPSAAEIRAFAALVGADLIEASLRCGIAGRGQAPPGADAGARIDHLAARLDAIDAWLEEFETAQRKSRTG